MGKTNEDPLDCLNLSSEPEIHKSTSVMGKQTHLVRTIATASLSMLSPKTNMFKTGSTSRAVKMARVATGSTADINDPKARLSVNSNW